MFLIKNRIITYKNKTTQKKTFTRARFCSPQGSGSRNRKKIKKNVENSTFFLRMKMIRNETIKKDRFCDFEIFEIFFFAKKWIFQKRMKKE